MYIFDSLARCKLAAHGFFIFVYLFAANRSCASWLTTRRKKVGLSVKILRERTLKGNLSRSRFFLAARMFSCGFKRDRVKRNFLIFGCSIDSPFEKVF